jgi:hypothetical protein
LQTLIYCSSRINEEKERERPSSDIEKGDTVRLFKKQKKRKERMDYMAIRSSADLLNKMEEDVRADDIPNDFFEQYLDLESANALSTSSSDGGSSSSTAPELPDELLLFSPIKITPELSCLKQERTQEEDPVKVDPPQLLVQHNGQKDELWQRSRKNYVHPAGESIPDSDLLRLEGVSLRSPHAPATLANLASPSAPPTQAKSPKKSDRFLEAISSTARRAATSRWRSRYVSAVVKGTSPEAMLGSCSTGRPARLRPDQFGIGNAKLLLSPLENSVPTTAGMGFVAGYVEDPFYNPNVASFPPVIARFDGLPTPMAGTPNLDDRHNINQSEATAYRASAHSPVSRDGRPAAPVQAMPAVSATVITDVGAAERPAYTHDGYMVANSPEEWWHTPSRRAIPTGHGKGRRFGDIHVENAKNVTLNMAMHMQQAERQYEYSADAARPQNQIHGAVADVNGLIIYMPQPRTASASVVHDLTRSAATCLPPLPPPPPIPYPQTEPRPRPRAPSSGARHLSTPMRKTQTARCSESTSPTSTNRGGSGSRHSSGDPATTPSRAWRSDSASSSVRKRRSWSRNPSFSGAGLAAAGAGVHGSSGGGGGGGARAGFVNFTPDDSGFLMAGVAPSGSSKTKARREKEAEERRRKLSEAAVKAVRAAGGDVERLARELRSS